LPGVARVPESRTEGALKDETTWPWASAWVQALLVRSAPAALAVGVLGAGACSAIAATVECREAERAVTQAVAADPAGIYQLTLARAYVEKAREEASEAHYGSATRLAQAAKAASARASASASTQGASTQRTQRDEGRAE
jgi:hypothetical protein